MLEKGPALCHDSAMASQLSPLTQQAAPDYPSRRKFLKKFPRGWRALAAATGATAALCLVGCGSTNGNGNADTIPPPGTPPVAHPDEPIAPPGAPPLPHPAAVPEAEGEGDESEGESGQAGGEDGEVAPDDGPGHGHAARTAGVPQPADPNGE